MAARSVSPGVRLRLALRAERPLQVVGVTNAYAAILAGKCGFKALYLSGAGVANASYGVPDIGITTLGDVLIDVRRITAITRLPLLVDAATTAFPVKTGVATEPNGVIESEALVPEGVPPDVLLVVAGLPEKTGAATEPGVFVPCMYPTGWASLSL